METRAPKAATAEPAPQWRERGAGKVDEFAKLRYIGNDQIPLVHISKRKLITHHIISYTRYTSEKYERVYMRCTYASYTQ